MILIKLQWITTVTWHGIKGVLMQLASVTNLMQATILQVKLIMKYGLVNGHWQLMYALFGLVDSMMLTLRTNSLANQSNVHIHTCLLISTQTLIDQQLI